jgi:cell division protein FtsB
MKLLTRFSNKYFIALAAFMGIMLFFDKNDLLTQMERRRDLRELRESRDWYTTQISAETKELEALKHNPATLEKYAREKYLMKRANEDLYIISENSDNGKN